MFDLLGGTEQSHVAPVARVVVSNVSFDPHPTLPGQRTITVHVVNNGPGVAYLGKSGFSFLFLPSGQDYSEDKIKQNLDLVLNRARSFALDKRVADDPGKSESFVMQSTVPEQAWQDVIHGRSTVYTWATYGYLDDTTGDNHLMVAYRVLRISGVDGESLQAIQAYQNTEMMERLN